MLTNSLDWTFCNKPTDLIQVCEYNLPTQQEKQRKQNQYLEAFARLVCVSQGVGLSEPERDMIECDTIRDIYWNPFKQCPLIRVPHRLDIDKKDWDRIAALIYNGPQRDKDGVKGNPELNEVDYDWDVAEPWLTYNSGIIVDICTKMFDSGMFNRMTELKENLRLAGCENEDVLSHCDNRLHVKGCWLIDTILGKGV